jgi:hypothetical protein
MAKLYWSSRNGLSVVGRRRAMVDKVAQAVVVVMVEAAVAVVEVMVVAAMEQVHQAGKEIVTSVGNQGTGPRIVKVSSPKRRKMSSRSRPKKRRLHCCLLRLNL